MSRNDDIIDAEWDEVPDERPLPKRPGIADQGTRKPDHPQQTSTDSASTPWRSKAFWHETVGTILIVVGRIGVIALGLIVLFFLAIAWADHKNSGASDFTDAAAGSQPPAKQSIDGKQMLQIWSQAVTGRADADGFTMVNGSGKPGDFCNNANGDTLMRFGGETTSGGAGINIYDFFAEFHDATNAGTIGAFWYDPSDGSLLARNQAAVSSNGKKGKSLPDVSHQVETNGDGRATIDGTDYHVCTL